MLSSDLYGNLTIAATEITKCEKKIEYYFLKAALPKKRFEIFCLIYSYFRLLDDIVDKPKLDIEILRKIVDDEKKYLTRLYERKCTGQVEAQSAHQYMLWHVVNYDVSQGCKMQRMIYGMFRGFEFDAEHRYKVCAQDILDVYAKTAGRNLVEFIWHFTCQDNHPVGFTDGIYLGGFGAQRIHNIRDFYEDYDLGYYYAVGEQKPGTLTAENFLKFADDPAWVKKEIDLAEEYIMMGIRDAKKIGNFRFRVFVTALSAKYLMIVRMIRRRKHSLSRKYKFTNMDMLRIYMWTIVHLLF